MQLEAIYIYPVKSLPGVALKRAELTPGGLRQDRRYMVVDQEGRFLTQRTEVGLGQLQLQLTDEAIVIESATGSCTLPLPGPAAEEELAGGDAAQVEIWRDHPLARVHAHASEFFSEHFGRKLRLVYLPEAELRQVNPARSEPGDLVSFADGYPLLFVNSASLRLLNRQAEELALSLGETHRELSVERFRPNLVGSLAEALEEETVRELLVGEQRFLMPKLCDRCVVTTIVPGSAEKTKEPLRSLSRHHRYDGALWFGANLIPRSWGAVQVGDELRVLARQPSPRGAADC